MTRWTVVVLATVACTTRARTEVPTVADFQVAHPCGGTGHRAMWSDSLPLISDTAQQHILGGKSALAHYPADLRFDYRTGAVRARFVIDTLGNVMPGSGFIEAASDEQFARVVCYALPQLKWAPVIVNGQKLVAGLVHVPFTFDLR